MDKKTTITLNGREYDAATGLPITKAVKTRTTRQSLRTPNTAKQTATAPITAPVKRSQPATTIHAKTQRSRTLNRKFVQKQTTNTTATQPESATTPVSVTAVQPIKQHPGTRIDGMRRSKTPTGSAARSTLNLARQNAAKRTTLEPLAHTPAVTRVNPQTSTQDAIPVPHPAVTRAHALQKQKQQAPAIAPSTPPASFLKQVAINEALDNAPKHSAKQHKNSKSNRGRSRFLSFVSGFAALVLFAGYVTYLNVPNLSVRVAAAQAGIDASYPGYRPDGYRLNGPVAFSEGEVQMRFAANTGSNNFTLSQARSNWDSGALLENYVKDKSDGDYITSQERGITVYSFGGRAAWVTGGILYTIDGDAPLSPEQIRKIATSV